MDGQIKVLSDLIYHHDCFKTCLFSTTETYFIFCYPCDYFEQTSDRDERVICYIVNSAEYCHKTVSWFLNSWYL